MTMRARLATIRRRGTGLAYEESIISIAALGKECAFFGYTWENMKLLVEPVCLEKK